MVAAGATELTLLSQLDDKELPTVSKESEKISNEEHDPDVICFTDNDPDDPMNWSALRKWLMVVAVSTTSMIAIFATTAIIPAAPQITKNFHVENDYLYTTLLVSIWELGEGVGPFFIGPLSERFGRLPTYHVGNLFSFLCNVASALSTNISMLCAFRFLGGALSPAGVLGPTIIGDLFPQEERGTAMSLGGGIQLIGPFIAPICGAFIANSLGWRWTLWVSAIAIAGAGVLCVLLLRETYAVKILERRAIRLRRETGNPRLRSKHQVHVDGSSRLGLATRPMTLLLLSPTLALVSFYTALAYGLSYTLLTTLTTAVESRYAFGHGVVGLAFLAPATGNVVGIALYGMTSDRYVKHLAKKTTSKPKAEHRLMHMLVGACTLPVGFLLYGWTLAYAVQWIVPLVGAAIIGFSMMLAILPTENYLVDAYEIHSASAMASGVILRAIFGAVFPLVGPPLYRKLGPGWGNSVLALIAVVFIPLLTMLVRYGGWVRRREKLSDTDPTS